MSEGIKSLKITATVHRALQLAKVHDGIRIQKWTSAAILEAMERDCPNAYAEIRKQLTTQD